MEDAVMDLRSYEDSCRGGLCDECDIQKWITEMKNARVGTIKPNWWEKIGEDTYIIYSL